MSFNFAEVTVANGCGVVIILLMMFVRLSNREYAREGEWIYNTMLFSTLVGLISETASFYIDGKQFFGSVFLQYTCNTLCTGATVFMGLIWCLFVNFRIFRNANQLKKMFYRIVMPSLVIMVLLFINLFGTNIIFGFDESFVYHRGPLNLLVYLVLLYYYASSVVMVHRSKKLGVYVKFFPVYYFIAPCVTGTVLQGLFYGLSIGWLSVAVAMVFVTLQLQTFNSFVDDLSGLFNRKYLNQCLMKVHLSNRSDVYGIMLDANNFKEINDVYGHNTGDRAIHQIGVILSDATINTGAIPFRMAGDEFLVLLPDGSAEKAKEMKKTIEAGVAEFNNTAKEPFLLSLSMGIAQCINGEIEDFLAVMDRKMYSAKKEYYMDHKKGEKLGMR